MSIRRFLAALVLAVATLVAAQARAGDDGPVVLLLHGDADTARVFGPTVESLRRRDARLRIHALDAPGPGIAARVRHVLAFMDAQGIRRAHVVGHAEGSLVAQAVAFEAPDRVASLVMVDTVVRPDDAGVEALLARLARIAVPVLAIQDAAEAVVRAALDSAVDACRTTYAYKTYGLAAPVPSGAPDVLAADIAAWVGTGRPTAGRPDPATDGSGALVLRAPGARCNRYAAARGGAFGHDWAFHRLHVTSEACHAQASFEPDPCGQRAAEPVARR